MNRHPVRLRLLALLAASALLAAACSGGEDAADSTTVPAGDTTTIPEPVTTGATETPATGGESTTTSEATSTTPPPRFDIGVRFDAGGDAAEVVGELYAWMTNPLYLEPPPMPDGLRDHLTAQEPSGDFFATGEITTGRIGDDDGPQADIAVATVGGRDVVLAVDDGDGWRIAGAKLASIGFDAWYGEPIRHVFVIGTDARPGQSQRLFRGDSLHILSSNVAEGAGAIMGFPRDTYVEAPYGGDKFTNVNALSGPDTMVEIASSLSGLPLDGYIVTGFVGFEQLVNEFGGVVVEVPFAMAEPKSDAYLNAGRQVLWGANALAFSRNRTIPGGDFTRSYHQGLVMLGAFDAVQATDISRLPGLLEILDRFTWTSLTPEQVLTVAAGAWEIDPATVINIVLPGTVATRGGASVVDLDQDAAAAVYADLADGYLTDPGE